MKRTGWTASEQKLARALLARAITIIASERRIIFESNRRPGTRSIPEPTARKTVRDYTKWLAQAQRVVRS